VGAVCEFDGTSRRDGEPSFFNFTVLTHLQSGHVHVFNVNTGTKEQSIEAKVDGRADFIINVAFVEN
jgi:hypothetical protein